MMPSVLFKNAALLDPLQPELCEGVDVLVENNLIKEVSDRPVRASVDRTIDLRGKTLMPGLIDLHVHAIATQLNIPQLIHVPNLLVTLRSTLVLRGMLRRGFTTVRDAAGAGHALKQAIETGLTDGPRMFVSGRALSQTGGHGDMRVRSDYLANNEPCPCCVRVGALARVVDGVDAVRKAAREELMMGADQIKIMASGGVASPTDPVGAFGYSEHEIRAIVEEARARQTYVLAHAYTAEAIARAVHGGVRTIEHGNLVDLPAARLMAEKGVYAVPTLVTYEALANEGDKFGLPPASVAKIADVRDAGLRSLEIFRNAGVKVGFGTDLLGESHRLQSEEFRIRAEIVGPRDVIASATVIAAEVLGMEGKLGRIMPDALADLLVVEGNPLRDVTCLLGQGDYIPLVMKAGKIYVDKLTEG